jgi:hypothetical protein
LLLQVLGDGRDRSVFFELDYHGVESGNLNVMQTVAKHLAGIAKSIILRF